MKEDYIILIHKFAAEHAQEGFLNKELLSYLDANGVSVEDIEDRRAIRRVLVSITINRMASSSEPHFIDPESYFRYLDYLEMKSAQDNAKSAHRWAIAAIVLSAAIGLLQLCLG